MIATDLIPRSFASDYFLATDFTDFASPVRPLVLGHRFMFVEICEICGLYRLSFKNSVIN